MSFSMSPPAPKPAPSPAQYQQQPPPPQQQQQQQQQQQSQPQQPPPAYQYPVQQQQSPAHAASPYAVPPPAKRQRLSPHPNSPPPPYQNATFHAPPANLPGSSSYGNPYAQSPAAAQSPYSPNNFVASPQASFNTPQPYPPQQMAWQSAPTTPAPAVQRAQQQSTGSPQPNNAMMPPPPRPNKEEKEEKGVDDVTDVMHGSGINLKDEENYLHTLYTNQHSKDSFATQSSSFGSGTLSGGNSFNTLQGTSFDGQNGNGAFAGTLGQAASQDDVEKEAKRKREVAAREKAERDQHHLNNPFLLGNVLRLRMDKIARESGVRLDVNGLYLLQQPAEPTKVMTNGTNSDGIVRPGSKIDQGAPFADILSLVSLAAGERVRGLLDESHALARARVYGDHNRVPPDLSDLAIAPGNESKDETIQPENITGTEWDRLPDAPGGPEDNDTSSASKPVPTISFQAKITDTFRQLAEADRLAEQARIRKREARRKAAEAAAANEDGAAAEAEIAAATSSTPSGPEQPKMTKKEQLKQQKEAKNAVEAQSSTTTNQTAAMMAMGKKGKKYSWMSGGAGAPSHTNRYIKPSATGGSGNASGGTSTPVKKEGGTPTANGESDDAGMAKWGELKEEKGVQLRDWVGVLERDGRERKALQKAWISLK